MPNSNTASGVRSKYADLEPGFGFNYQYTYTPPKPTEALIEPRGSRVGRIRLWLDAAHGYFDGWRGLPEVTAADADTDTLPSTAHLRRIEQSFETERTRVRIRYQTQLTNCGPSKIDLDHQIDVLRDKLKWATEEITDLEQAGPATGARVGEEGLDPDLVARRRENEYRKRLALLRDMQATIKQHLGGLIGVRTATDTAEENLAREYELACEHILAHFRKRHETYLAGAQRSHPDPAGLAEVFGEDTVPADDDTPESPDGEAA